MQKYERMKAEMVRAERHLLREMGFVVHVEHPHKFVVNYLQILQCGHELMQLACNIVNDRYVSAALPMLNVVQ